MEVFNCHPGLPNFKRFGNPLDFLDFFYLYISGMVKRGKDKISSIFLLNSKKKVEGCDATMLNRSTSVWLKKTHPVFLALCNLNIFHRFNSFFLCV